MILDGKSIAASLRCRVKEKVDEIGIKTHMVVILVGNDSASHIYVNNKANAAKELGIQSTLISFPSSVSEPELLSCITKLNKDELITGVLVQLPLPKHIDNFAVINAIDSTKDLDCFHLNNVGKLLTGHSGVKPCTPHGCMYLIKQALGDNLSSLEAVIIGRSNIVGKPMSMMLLKENVTVTMLHSHSKNLVEHCRRANIVVAALGKPNFVKGDWLSKDAVVIDVGINRVDGKLCGDIDYDSAYNRVKAITKVPGGVGPMTIAFLLINALMLACQQKGIELSYNDII